MNVILNKEPDKRRINVAMLMYLILMILFYGIYISLESDRIVQSQQWTSGGFISEQGIKSMSQMGRWTSITESLFLVLFVLVMIIMITRYRRNVRKLIPFALWNVALFVGVGAFSLVGSQMTSMSVGNLVQPIIVPAFLLAALFIYVVWGLKKLG
ncbi:MULTISPECIES: hypothetical protein [unclassified Paenibacillus]|uniref:hypothetical protein n=1 Tax=unclassified Paenibacillus TaxID=185978 RepID=UPI000464459C|nr:MULTISPECIES: hypothetical protein [unclassified Paenibacillus]KGP84603.1 hypothetical protein P364_0104105 [Paenibacillus sp. MAEPY2]KGP86770.1 hypothetical protein P363_0115775 [Paenibacillus sp. MAEPY1]